jgi:hypothetical protein
MENTTIAQKINHELRRYAIISAYLYVCFAALILYKTSILRGQGFSYAFPFGFAAIKALLLGKFVLIGQATGIGDRYDRRRLIHVIAYKAFLLLALLLVLSVVEALVVGLLRGRTIAASISEVAGGTLLQLLASCLIILLILIPYLTFQAINQVLGAGRLRQILFERQTRLRHPNPQV